MCMMYLQKIYSVQVETYAMVGCFIKAKLEGSGFEGGKYL